MHRVVQYRKWGKLGLLKELFSQEPKAKSQEPKAKSQKTRAKSQKTRAKRQEPKDKSQKPKDKSQKAEAKSQKILRPVFAFDKDFLRVVLCHQLRKSRFIIPHVAFHNLPTHPHGNTGRTFPAD